MSRTSSSCVQPGRRLLVRAEADDLAGRAVPDRDAVAPPQLPGDAPVVHVVHPGEPARLELLRVDDDAPVAHRVARGLRQRPDLDEPLHRQPRLDRLVRRALVVADAVPVRALLRDDPALRAQRLADGDARLEPVHAVELGARAGDDARLVHDRRHRQAVPAADLEVVGVVRGSHLDRAGAELRVDVVVGEDRDPAPDQRQLDLAADQVPVALVVRVHDDGGVAQHRLDPRGGHDDRVGPVAVADRHQLAVDLLVLHLDVGQHAAQRRRPVDHPLGAVDQAVVVQPLEHRADGAVAARRPS